MVIKLKTSTTPFSLNSFIIDYRFLGLTSVLALIVSSFLLILKSMVIKLEPKDKSDTGGASTSVAIICPWP